MSEANQSSEPGNRQRHDKKLFGKGALAATAGLSGIAATGTTLAVGGAIIPAIALGVGAGFLGYALIDEIPDTEN